MNNNNACSALEEEVIELKLYRWVSVYNWQRVAVPLPLVSRQIWDGSSFELWDGWTALV